MTGFLVVLGGPRTGGAEDTILNSYWMRDSDLSYWYRTTPATIEKYIHQDILHLAFIIGSEGGIKLPFEILKEYISEANTSLNPDAALLHHKQ